MQLLILLNGREDLIVQANKLDPNTTQTIKIDEKLLVSFKAIINLINKSNAKTIYFGCIENELQRFHFFMMLYVLLSNVRSGGIIDEDGNCENYSAFRFFSNYLPRFIAESIVSIIVVKYYYIKIPVLKWILSKKK